MRGILKIINDRIGNGYLAVDVPVSEVVDYENWMLSKNLFECLANKKKRDAGNYHITVVPVFDWIKLPKPEKELVFEKFIGKEFDFDDFGIGFAEKGSNKAWFIVIKSDFLNQIRRDLGLKDFDFHITMGFSEKDVFGVPKNEKTIIDRVVVPKRKVSL